MNLSPHFTLAEMTHTSVNLPNDPPQFVVQSLSLVCATLLEPVRAHFGKPVTVNSGYRAPKVNAGVGGSTTSQHVLGQAVDFEVPGVSNLDVARWVRDHLDFDQLILEARRPGDPSSGWVHASYRGGRLRKSVLTMTMGAHGPIYSAGLPS